MAMPRRAQQMAMPRRAWQMAMPPRFGSAARHIRWSPPPRDSSLIKVARGEGDAGCGRKRHGQQTAPSSKSIASGVPKDGRARTVPDCTPPGEIATNHHEHQAAESPQTTTNTSSAPSRAKKNVPGRAEQATPAPND